MLTNVHIPLDVLGRRNCESTKINCKVIVILLSSLLWSLVSG